MTIINLDNVDLGLLVEQVSKGLVNKRHDLREELNCSMTDPGPEAPTWDTLTPSARAHIRETILVQVNMTMGALKGLAPITELAGPMPDA